MDGRGRPSNLKKKKNRLPGTWCRVPVKYRVSSNEYCTWTIDCRLSNIEHSQYRLLSIDQTGQTRGILPNKKQTHKNKFRAWSHATSRARKKQTNHVWARRKNSPHQATNHTHTTVRLSSPTTSTISHARPFNSKATLWATVRENTPRCYPNPRAQHAVWPAYTTGPLIRKEPRKKLSRTEK